MVISLLISLGCAGAGFFLQLGCAGALVFTLLFSLHLLLSVWFISRPKIGQFVAHHIWSLSLSIAFLCVIAAVIPLLPTTLVSDPDQTRFGAYVLVGGWCWIARPYTAARYVLLYIWVFLVCGLCLVSTLLTIYVVWRTAQFSKKKKMKLLFLLFFPLIIILVWLPGIILRGIESAGAPSPFWLAMLRSITLPSEGWINTLLYFVNRRSIYQVKPLREKSTKKLDGSNKSGDPSSSTSVTSSPQDIPPSWAN